MVSNISATPPPIQNVLFPKERGPVSDRSAKAPTDIVQFGAKPVSNDQAMNVVLERAMARLRAVVGDARAELGIPEGTIIDTSAEATAGRIVDFALGAFSAWSKNHPDIGEDEAREQFAQFIGGAISQGIQEARGILGALQALSPDVDNNINSIAEIISQRLGDFVAGV